MNVWNAFPFIRYSLALIAGILLYGIFPGFWEKPVFTFFFLIILIFVAAYFQRSRHLFLSRVFSGFFILIMLAFLGGILFSQKDVRKSVDHFTHLNGEVAAFSGLVSSDHHETEKYHRYVFELGDVILENRKHQVSGSIYLYVRKDSLKTVFPYGTKLFVNGNYFQIDEPANPDEFNYKQYLARKGIFAQGFVTYDEIDSVGFKPANPIMDFAYSVRSHCSQLITRFIPGESESAVMNALLIGVKDFLDNEIKEAYSAVGAMHVLAVSGLHVGIVYLLILILFGQLKRTPWGRVLFVLISLLTIWSYALITGFSPSVMRASTMFSVIVIGESTKRKSNIYNSLGLAAFILLVYNPYFVFDVGFQLSFIAVFGIVTFQPPIYQLWQPGNVVLDYLWALISVSIAAQLVTFPLSLFYFNQFPAYFLISNIIIIPAALVMLTTGLFMLGVGSISIIVGETVGFMLGSFVEMINWLILKIQMLPGSTIDWLHLSSISVLLIYLFMLFSFFGLKNRQFSDFALSLVFLLLLVLNFNYEAFVKVSQKRIMIYQHDDHLAIDLIKGTRIQLITISQPAQLNEMASFNINPHRLASGLEAFSTAQVFQDGKEVFPGIHLYIWDGLRIMIVASETQIQADSVIGTDIMIMQSHQPSLLDSIRTKHLILGQMPWWERQKTKAYLQQKMIEYFDMFESGYFELDLSGQRDQISYH